MPGILDVLGGPVSTLLGGIRDLVVGKVTNEGEKIAASAKLAELELGFRRALLEADVTLAGAQKEVIVAEAESASWIARNWRPLLMLTFTFIIAWNYIVAPIFSTPRAEIPESMWELLKLGVGGYILGRSGEKIATVWKKNGH